ncbi:MAG: hypothetical protein KA956_00475 [Pyrinomonadaceae bacterium]|nr:hypothetical protein [Acidobacteriota bacterium]MBK7932746.1 hypothetical protein [Acidobacteriota bacterium]MBP7374926.1 hypothetical protein [Pyrinomonadaceae bacterium]
MNEGAHFSGYDLRSTNFVGSVASFCPIFSFLLLAFISYHPVFITTTIDEMVSYWQIFAVSVFAYLAAALVTWKSAKTLSTKVSVWFPISMVGSILFTAAFMLWEAMNILLGRTENQSEGDQLALWILYSTLFLIVLSGICTSISFSIYDSYEKKTHEPL